MQYHVYNNQLESLTIKKNPIHQYCAGFEILGYLCNHKATVLEYIKLNGKSDLTGCGLNWYSLVSILS